MKLNVNFPQESLESFFRNEQRTFYSIVNTVLREHVTCRETVAQPSKNLLAHEHTSKKFFRREL